jgi:alpha-tubulin suppressor-like RCC1 family protein
VTDLQTHFYFGVARTSGGDYRAWGENTSRQLADGTTIDRPVPIAAPNIPAGTLAIAVGSDHTCFLTAAGGVKCFGSNGYGQLGDGTTTAYSATPVDVVGLASGVTSISAGYQYTCANVGGAAMCWGDNSGGKLGNGNQTLQRSPAAVSGLGSGVGQVIAGWLHTCAIVTGGGLKCWGRAEDGQLGDGVAALVSLTPVDVAGLGSGVAAAALGSYHTCALTTGGALKCWGYNGYGQLGRSTGALNLPADVTGLGSGVLALPNALGWDHTCAVVAGGGAKCWGRNDTGQIGDNTTSTRYVPVDVTGLTSGVTALTLGYQHTCALDGSGVARCWGDNSHSQLGDGTGAQRRTPVPLSTN